MKLEQQVCSLELAKNLKELGIDQRGAYFAYEEGYPGITFRLSNPHDLPIIEEMIKKQTATFTVAELGVMLPKYVKDYIFGSGPIDAEDETGWAAGYIGEDWEVIYEAEDNSEADARAKLLIYLLENELITVEEVNKRLEES